MNVMAKQKASTVSSFWHELLRMGLYKRSQGRITRQVTFAAVGAAVALGAWQLWQVMAVSRPDFVFTFLAWLGATRFESALSDAYPLLRHPTAGFLLLLGLWLGYRLVNYQRFADFLIAVEAEMNKVSWPSRIELFRSAIVVIVVIFALAAILFVYDFIWRWLFQLMGIVL